MKVVRDPRTLQNLIASIRGRRRRIGFVPTMGALHAGHLSLVRRARRENGAVIVSIFVNPLQFGPKEDYRRYPRDLAGDQALLKKAGADVLFAPAAGLIYGSDFQTEVQVKRLSEELCGRSRPVHFAGVATVVTKLLNLVRPDTLYLGQKDYQQYRVIAQLVKDLAMPVDVRLCPTVRERDGLAMSSRNVFLTVDERESARSLSRALAEATRLVRRGERSAGAIRRRVTGRLRSARGAKPEYAEVVDAGTLKPVVQLKFGQKILVAVAVRFSKARLIDNRLIRVK